MKSSVVKRSIVIDGHKTSVSLEDAFWTDLKNIVNTQQKTLSELVTQIDKTRFILWRGGEKAAHICEHQTRQRPESPESRIAAIAEAGIDADDRHLAGRGLVEMLRPAFAFGQNHKIRIDLSPGADRKHHQSRGR